MSVKVRDDFGEEIELTFFDKVYHKAMYYILWPLCLIFGHDTETDYDHTLLYEDDPNGVVFCMRCSADVKKFD